MKYSIFIFGLIFVSFVYAERQDSQNNNTPVYDEVTIDWKDKENPDQEYTSVLLCDGNDDIQKSGVDLYIPGQTSYEGAVLIPGYVTYESCGLDWKLLSVEALNINGKKMTRIRVEGSSDCKIKIEKEYNDKTPALLTIYETC